MMLSLNTIFCFWILECYNLVIYSVSRHMRDIGGVDFYRLFLIFDVSGCGGKILLFISYGRARDL